MFDFQIHAHYFKHDTEMSLMNMKGLVSAKHNFERVENMEAGAKSKGNVFTQ